jgi:hypothetical protein
MYEGHFEITHSSRTAEAGYSTNRTLLDAANNAALYLILNFLFFILLRDELQRNGL